MAADMVIARYVVSETEEEVFWNIYGSKILKEEEYN